METTSRLSNGAKQDDVVHLRDLWNLLVRNRLLIGILLALSVGGAVAYTMNAVPVFESVTSIRIEEERSELPVLDVIQTLSAGSQIETEMEVLRSRTLAEAVVDSLALQARIQSPRGVARSTILGSLFVERWATDATYVLEHAGDGSYAISAEGTGVSHGTVSTTEPAALPGATFTLQDEALEFDRLEVRILSFERAVESLQGSVTVSRPNREAGIVTVRHESTDTQLVHQVPNGLAGVFIARRQTFQKTEATSAVAFLEEQIGTLAGQLAAAEEELTAFREGEQVVSIQAEATAQVTQLARMQADRNLLDADRAALQSLVDEIEIEAATAEPTAASPYTRLISFPTLIRNNAVSELLRTLNEANAERSALLERRTMEDPEVIALTNRVRDTEEQLRITATTYLQGLTNQVNALDQTLSRFGTELERIPAKEVQLARLERRTSVLEDVFTSLQNRLQESRILEAVEDASIRVVDPAILPSRPVRPRRILNLMFGLLLGLALGVGAAFTRDYMDESVHTRDDVQQATGDAPILGLIPTIHQASSNGRALVGSPAGDLGATLVAGRDPRNPVSEAYRSLRTNLTFSNPDRPPRTLVFTSPQPKDGKSTSAANLSITLAQQGIKALLVDADLRRGILGSVFGVSREPGLTNVLAGSVDTSEAIREIDLGESGTLHFLPSGPFPPNPAEILGSQRMRTLLEELGRSFELVIIDSAPLTVVTDAAVLGTKADGVVLVARANVTEKGALRYAVDQLNNVRAPILGAVLNDVDFRRDSRYHSGYGKWGYYYQYYYTDDKGRKQKDREAKKS